MARPGLDRHPKFRMLCRLLGEPRPHVRGYLELLWDTAYENGDDLIGDSDTVEAVCDFPGKRGKLTAALLNCGGNGKAGFIMKCTQMDGFFRIHDLFDHAPEYVKKRWKRECARRTTADNGGQRQTTAENGAPPAPAPAPAPNTPLIPLAGGQEGFLFGSEAFANAWQRWRSYKGQQKPETEAAQLDYLKTLGEHGAIDRINESITNGWSGLRYQRRGHQGANGKPTLSTDEITKKMLERRAKAQAEREEMERQRLAGRSKE